MKENGQVLHRSTYQALNQQDWEQEECKAKHNSFIASLHQKLGPCSELRDLVEVGAEDTPQFDPYEENHKMLKCFPCWMRSRGNPRVGGPVCEQRNIAPARGQNGQRQCVAPEA